jgi:hypothetical protein
MGPSWVVDVRQVLSVAIFREKMLRDLKKKIFQLCPGLTNIVL